MGSAELGRPKACYVSNIPMTKPDYESSDDDDDDDRNRRKTLI